MIPPALERSPPCGRDTDVRANCDIDVSLGRDLELNERMHDHGSDRARARQQWHRGCPHVRTAVLSPAAGWGYVDSSEERDDPVTTAREEARNSRRVRRGVVEDIRDTEPTELIIENFEDLGAMLKRPACSSERSASPTPERMR